MIAQSSPVIAFLAVAATLVSGSPVPQELGSYGGLGGSYGGSYGGGLGGSYGGSYGGSSYGGYSGNTGLSSIGSTGSYGNSGAYAETYSHPEAEEHYPDTPAHYNFKYEVTDFHTGDAKSHSETREGDTVRGAYSVADPDGHFRIVNYYADPHSGFVAHVSRIPIGHGAAAPVAPIAPIAHAAPIASIAAIAPISSHY